MSQNNPNITVSQHACERLIERFHLFAPGNPSKQIDAAEAFIRRAWEDAKYVSDDPDGILFQNKMFDVNIVLKDRRIITVFHVRTAREKRMRRAAQLDASPGNRISDGPDSHVPEMLKVRTPQNGRKGHRF